MNNPDTAPEPQSAPLIEGQQLEVHNSQGAADAGLDAPPGQEAGESFVRVCPKCSVQSAAGGKFCPNCGASYEAVRRPFPFNKKGLLIAAATLLLVAGGIGLALNIQHTNQVNAEQAAAAAEAEATKTRESEEAAAAASAAADKQAADDSKRAERTIIVKALEDSILKDAKGRVTTGVLDGPILLASCTPLGGGSTDDLTALTGTFECIAVNKKESDGSSSGYRFSATVDWNAGSYSWHLGS